MSLDRLGTFRQRAEIRAGAGRDCRAGESGPFRQPEAFLGPLRPEIGTGTRLDIRRAAPLPPPVTTPPLRLLQNAMQAYTWRLKALSSNLANLDTPGYNRLSVSFEESLQRARRSELGMDRDHVAARMQQDGRSPILEDELMELADTQMRTQLTTRALHEHFARLRTGITGRQG